MREGLLGRFGRVQSFAHRPGDSAPAGTAKSADLVYGKNRQSGLYCCELHFLTPLINTKNL